MLQRWLFHLACVLALAAPAFVNGQPFYFPDSTAYTRAADSAAYVFSGHRISTEWTDRYRSALEKGGQLGAVRSRVHVGSAANDLSAGIIMAGRSPYFGALLWLSYVLSRFWLFVVAQAAIAYALIRLSLRLFGLARPAIVAGVVAALALLTSLPFFAALLMPDLLAGFGILAFLLLAIDRGRLRSGERWALYALILVSVISHITHVLIIAIMVLLLFAWAKLKRWPRPQYKRLIGASSLIVLVGTLSVMFTSFVVEQTFGTKPLLVPLLTARFLADGTGLAYIKQNCPEEGFAACAYRDRSKVMVVPFLWSLKPGEGAYMIAPAEQRRALSIEDKAFAWAVLRAYPREQGRRILYNGVRQMLRFDLDLLDYRCFGKPRCWSSLPPRERASLLASLGGRDLWPQRSLAIIHYGAVAAALIFLLAWASSATRRRGEGGEDILLWFTLMIVAFWVNALVGGGVSEPQPRYQARVIWLLPLLAMLAGSAMASSPDTFASERMTSVSRPAINPAMQADIAVILPCYNEEAAIGATIAGFRAALPDARIYVFDNNSKDSTAEVARAAGAIVRTERMQGKGHVVRRMFADVEADIYVMADGDATYDAAAAPELIRMLLDERLDMVVGARKSEIDEAYRRGHRVGNAMLTGILARLFGRTFSDILSGYRVFSRRFVKSFPVLSAGFEIETEISIHALELQMPVGEVITQYGARPEGSTSKLSTYRDGFRILWTIMTLFRIEKPTLFFGTIGALLALAAIILAIPLGITYLDTGLVPRLPTALLSTGLMILAVLNWFCGLILATVVRGRREVRRLAYLGFAVPGSQDRGA